MLVVGAAAGMAAAGAISWRGQAGLAIIAGIALAGVLVAWVVLMPSRLAPPLDAQELAQITDRKARLEAADARLRLRHDLRNGTLQTLAVVAVLAGAVLGFWQLAEDRSDAAADRELTRQGQASERFTRAISQLGDGRVETRIGGIYGLAQVADQAPDNNGPVGEVLLAYINRLPRPKTRQSVLLKRYAPDVQAALTVLTQRDKDHDGTKDYAWLANRLQLGGLSLGGVDLRGAYLSGASFDDADLTGSDLRNANLHGTYLGFADLDHADVQAADLSGASLNRAHLQEADLSGANLSDAVLFGADLFMAHLHDTDLRGADLSYARLGAADLRNADLRNAQLHGADLSDKELPGADLTNANLSGVDLTDANLSRASLEHADLHNADLSGANLRGAWADDRTRWPERFDLRQAGVQLT
jgi:uncharacterized protein YjbI with pentapeptide repeats